MKSFIFTLIVAITASLLFSFSLQDDYSDCLVKAESKWGEKHCLNVPPDDTYRVSLKNTCKENIDVKVAVQENDKRWKTYLFTEMKPEEVVAAYACKGTGKYLYWAKKTGDNSVEFPTDAKITAEYGK
jgi:hypothetical protein